MNRTWTTKLLGSALAAVAVVSAAYWIFFSLTRVMVDIDVYRAAGQELLQRTSLYDSDGIVHNLPYLYPPFAAFVFAPLGLLSEVAARFAWTVLLFAALFVILRLSLQIAAPALLERHGVKLLLPFGGAALLMEPVWNNFGFGQINLVIVMLVLADLARRTGRVPTGVALGIAGALKLTPMLFAVLWFFAGRRRDALVAVGSFLTCSAIGLLAAWQDSIDYWGHLAYDSTRIGVAYVTNQSLNGVWSRLLDGPQNVPLALQVGFMVIGVAGLVIAVLAVRRGVVHQGYMAAAATTLVVSPISWSHHWVWIIPILVLFVTSKQRALQVAGLGLWAFFIVSPLRYLAGGGDVEFEFGPLMQLAASSYLLLALAYLVFVAYLATRKTEALKVSATTDH